MSADPVFSKKITSLDSKAIRTHVLDVRDAFQRVTTATVATASGAIDLSDPEDLVDFYAVDCGGAARALNLPTAANLYAYLNVRGRYAVGATIFIHITNTSDADEPITVAAGTGGTEVGNMVVEYYVGTALNTGASLFALRMTSASAYQCIRVA